MRSLIKLFTYIIFIGVAVFPIYAFAYTDSAGNMPGEGTGTIIGWTTSNVHYELGDDPSFVKSVSFDLDGPASIVSVTLSSTSTEFTSCANLNASHWRCEFSPNLQIAAMDEFRVIAVGN